MCLKTSSAASIAPDFDIQSVNCTGHRKERNLHFETNGKAIVEVIEILAKMLPEISIRYYMARTLSKEGEDRCCFSYRLAFNAKIQYNRYVYLLMKRMCLFATYRPICMIWEDKRIVMNELFQRFVLNTKEVLHLIRIAIVEDDEAERIRIKEYLTYLAETDHLQFEIDSFPSGLAFIAQYTGQFDIVLMDIDMPGMDGVETARALREVDQSAILVFVTNMAQYAISGYEVEALDFILKPIKKFSFAIKMRRAVARTEKKNDDTICVKQDGVTHLLLISQIKYLEVEGHYVAYHTSNGIYSEYTTLKKAEKRINRTWFAQCNQSYLLNMKYINSLSRDSVVVDGKEIFISRKMRHSFLAAVAEFLGGKNQ